MAGPSKNKLSPRFVERDVKAHPGGAYYSSEEWARQRRLENGMSREEADARYEADKQTNQANRRKAEEAARNRVNLSAEFKKESKGTMRKTQETQNTRRLNSIRNAFREEQEKRSRQRNK